MDPNNLNPKLPYADFTIGLPTNKGPHYDQIGLKTRVLLDTGAGKTTMTYSFYMKLMTSFNAYKHALTVVPNYVIQTIVGSTTQISGMAKFRLMDFN